MLLGLTTDQKLGLAGTAAVFIGFALVTALLIPRYRPDFPGRKGLGLFIVVTLLLTVAMLGAVVVFASRGRRRRGGRARGNAVDRDRDQPDRDRDRPDRDRDRPDGDDAGDDRARGGGAGGRSGRRGGASHRTAAAAATRSRRQGARGGRPEPRRCARGDAEFVHQSIVEPNAEVAEGYNPGIMPSFQQLSEDQVNDLVAFLTQR